MKWFKKFIYEEKYFEDQKTFMTLLLLTHHKIYNKTFDGTLHEIHMITDTYIDYPIYKKLFLAFLLKYEETLLTHIVHSNKAVFL